MKKCSWKLFALVRKIFPKNRFSKITCFCKKILFCVLEIFFDDPTICFGTNKMLINRIGLCNNVFRISNSVENGLFKQITPLSLVQTRNKCQAGRYKITLKRNRPLTYEMANKPSHIGVRKGWNSWNTSSLVGSERSSEVTIDDMFIRSFMNGTWHRLFLSELIIKRRANMIILNGICLQSITPSKFYFLIGYTEELLSHFLKCPVKVDIQTTSDRNALIYKYI